MQVDRIEVQLLYRIPTDRPEADGTYQWDSTTVVVIDAIANSGLRGLGLSYASAAAASLIHEQLAPVVIGRSIDDVGAAWNDMVKAVRNVGRQGIASTAISALDISLWDLKARALGIPLFRLLGPRRQSVPIYGSGGFTSYSEDELAEQLAGWVQQGIPRVKMKIGTDWGARPADDLSRVRVARRAIGPDADLFVDANGAYTTKEAIDLAGRMVDEGVSYFEEPVSSDQLAQMAFVRDHVPMSVAAGEYGYDPWYFRDMLAAGAVDILQADATRCLGVTGWLEAANLAYAFGTPFSAHTAPAVHAHAGCAAPQISHVEYFHDHVRIEQMLFEGVPEVKNGRLYPDPERPGLGLELKRQDAEQWRVDR